MPLTPMDPDPDAQFPEQTELDDEFFIVFGPRPTPRDFQKPSDFRQALAWWSQQYRNFEGIVRDDDEAFDAAAAEADAYGLGRPVKYRFGSERVHVFFPEVLRLSPLSGSRVDFEAFYFTAGVGQTIARIQSWIIREGHFVLNIHPFVPFHLRSINQGNFARFANATVE